MRVHFIAIGGAAMHNLAIAMHKKGDIVSGSDDEIFEPSRSRLLRYNLLPKDIGWDPDRINKDLDAIILGMHAKADNPELKRAQELGIKIFSYPEYLYEHSKNKFRVVIGGSHGKTTITAMILHVLKFAGIDADYMVGAQLDGFEVMVSLSQHARIMIFEGDEYLTSPIDRRPKFHLYKPNLALLSGIAWDHINVFPTIDDYEEQFRIFINLIEKNGKLVYCKDEETLNRIVKESKNQIHYQAYSLPEYFIEQGITYLKEDTDTIRLQIFGKHNLLNLNGARMICRDIGVSDELFLEAIKTFKGASNRLEKIAQDQNTILFKDFAHSPSKLKATISAVKNQFPERNLVACMELHTFSSLNLNFLDEYAGSMDGADIAFIFYNPETLKHKGLPPISPDQVRKAFKHKNLKVYSNSEELISYLLNHNWKNKNLLLMSSGNFDGLNYESFARNIIPRS